MRKPNYPVLFEQLWTVYPKKEAKPAALKAFLKLEVTAEDVDLLIPCALKYKRMWESQNRERKHIPSMGPWLRSDPLDSVIDLPETDKDRYKREEKEMIERRERLSAK